jgi:hypothetical protein
VTLTPSGVVVGDGTTPGGIVFGNLVVVSLAQLDPGSNSFMQVQQLAGGLSPVSISLGITAGTITSPVVINPGSDSASATATAPGTVTVTTPPGFTDSDHLTVFVFF